jgi:AcrR family transcriptional regulator
MAKKAPRRTAERIVETSLVLFNRFGELNVTTNMIAEHVGISPGNLHYHFPTKSELITFLYNDFQNHFEHLLKKPPAANFTDIEKQLTAMVRKVWDYRFLFRDLSHFLNKNRHLEIEFPKLMRQQSAFFDQSLRRLGQQGHLELGPEHIDQLAQAMSILLTHWISEEYVQAPRLALEPEQANLSQDRVVNLIMCQIAPYKTGAPTAPR